MGCHQTLLATPLLALIVAFGCEMPPDERVEPASATFTLLWTGAITGELDPCDCPYTPFGGLPRLSNAIDQELEYDREALLIDLGDFAGDVVEDSEVDGAIARRERAWLVLEAMGLMGYQALLPGERDLTLGVEDLVDATAGEGIDILGTNLWLGDPDEPLGLTEIRVDTAAGAAALISISEPLDQDELDAAERGHDRPLEVLEPVPALSLAIESARSWAMFVILVAHGPTDWATDLLTQVEGVDLCLVAHHGDGPGDPVAVGDSFLLTTGENGKYLNRLRITLYETGGASIGGAKIEVVEEYGEDPVVVELVENLAEREENAQRALDDANEEAEHPSGQDYVGYSSCGTCHSEQANSWYSTPHIDAFHELQRIGLHIESECFQCHTTGFGYRGGFTSRNATPGLSGVTCEACHGPGDEECEGSGRVQVDETTCRACHTDATSPEFDFETWVPRIRHTSF